MWSFVWLLWLGRVKNALRSETVFDPAGRLNGPGLVTKGFLCMSLLLSDLLFWLVRAWSSRPRKAHSPSQRWRERWVDGLGSRLNCVSMDDERYILRSFYLIGLSFIQQNIYLVLVDIQTSTPPPQKKTNKKLAAFLKEFIWNMGKVTILTNLLMGTPNCWTCSHWC